MKTIVIFHNMYVNSNAHPKFFQDPNCELGREYDDHIGRYYHFNKVVVNASEQKQLFPVPCYVGFKGVYGPEAEDSNPAEKLIVLPEHWVSDDRKFYLWPASNDHARKIVETPEKAFQILQNARQNQFLEYTISRFYNGGRVGELYLYLNTNITL